MPQERSIIHVTDSSSSYHSTTRTLTIIALFTSVIIASDYAMAPIVNVKLLDTLVFSVTFVFGFRIGASVAVISELIWGTISPFGFFLPIIPFLVIGELLYVAAGYLASKIWGGKEENVGPLSSRNLYFGATLAICAFIWDLETNLATGLIGGAHGVLQYLGFLAAGIVFAVPHELSDFILGASLAPIIIVYCRRLTPGQPQRKKEKAKSEAAATSTKITGKCNNDKDDNKPKNEIS